MRLRQHTRQETRLLKTVKHWFCRSERWWQVSSTSLDAWEASRFLLDAEGAFSILECGFAPVLSDRAEIAAQSAYQGYLHASETACVHALERGLVSPEPQGRSRLLGRSGITVIGIAREGDYDFVTAWRCLLPRAGRRPRAGNRGSGGASNAATRESTMNRAAARRASIGTGLQFDDGDEG